MFSRMQQWVPLWLTEGIAEFYQNPEILEDRVRLGKAVPSFQAVIERYPRLPLSTLFAVDAHSPYYHGNDKGSIKSSFQESGTHRIPGSIVKISPREYPLKHGSHSLELMRGFARVLLRGIVDNKKMRRADFEPTPGLTIGRRDKRSGHSEQ